MKQQLLLLEDVDGLGRSGDVVTAKPGFIRNFLLPQKKAVTADKRTLKMQARLKEERERKRLSIVESRNDSLRKSKDWSLPPKLKSIQKGKCTDRYLHLISHVSYKKKDIHLKKKIYSFSH